MIIQDKLIINFAPTGMVPTQTMTQHVPIDTNEIIEQVHEAAEIGITLVHLHAREPKTGKPTWRKEIYGQIMEGIRKYCPELPLCISLSGRNFNEFEKRSESLELYPDMGSLTLSSLNFSQQESVNSPEMIQKLAAKMLEFGVNPELEVFDLGMIHYGHFLIKKGFLKPPFYWNIIGGNVAGMQSDLIELGLAVKQLPHDSHWAFGGIGRQQLTANMLAIASGGGVRIGLEDNIYYDNDRKVLATNSALLRRIHILAAIAERPLMSPSEFGGLGFYNTKRKRK
jgi:3-keto-5-aminohexanoate cleavage enzyme